MPGTLWAAAIGALALVQAPAPEPAATPADVVDAQFKALAEHRKDVTQQGRFRGSLDEDARVTQTLTLTAGATYLVAAGCDADCSDLDLWIRGPDGAVVGEDAGDDDVPVAQFTAPASGDYRLEVLMAACGKAPCRYGLEVYRLP